jgi:hypothetical protein
MTTRKKNGPRTQSRGERGESKEHPRIQQKTGKTRTPAGRPRGRRAGREAGQPDGRPDSRTGGRTAGREGTRVTRRDETGWNELANARRRAVGASGGPWGLGQGAGGCAAQTKPALFELPLARRISRVTIEQVHAQNVNDTTRSQTITESLITHLCGHAMGHTHKAKYWSTALSRGRHGSHWRTISDLADQKSVPHGQPPDHVSSHDQAW